MREKEFDLGLNFEQSSPVANLVDETYQEFSGDGTILPNGRLNSDLLIKNAKILLLAGDTKLAKNIFRSLIENGDMLSVAYAGIGAAFELEGKIDLAIKSYRESIIYEPTYGSLFALADLLMKQQDYGSAVGTLLRANNLPKITLDQSFEIHKCLGNCYMYMNQLNNAEAHYRKAYEIHALSDGLHVNIGSLALKKGDTATALLHFKEAIRINAKSASAYTGVGLAHLGQGNKQQAHDAFASALRVDIHEATALYNLVKTAYELKQFSVVSEILNEYIINNPVNSNILYSYAGILFHQGKYSEAADECDKLLSFNSNHEGAKKIKAMIERSAKK